MAEADRPQHRHIVYCLLCQKPQKQLATHLARVCMKAEPGERRAQELARARESMRKWTQTARVWDYEEMRQWCPDPVCRDGVVAELKRRNCFVLNCPGAEGSEAPSGRVLPSFRTLHQCLTVVRVALPDMLGISRNLRAQLQVSEEQKTRLKYFCQAVLILKHCLKPAAVEAMSARNWVERQPHGGRVIVRVDGSIPSMVTFALSEDDAAMLDVYYLKVRATYMQVDSGDDKGLFFLSQSGSKVRSAGQDMSRLHSHYNLPTVSSQDARRVVEAKLKCCPEEQQVADLRVYLALCKQSAGGQHRMLSPDEIVAAANQLANLQESSAHSDDNRPQPQKRARESGGDQEADFGAFLQSFPVTLDRIPPSKEERAQAGYGQGRSLYDRWRAEQLKMREQFLLAKWTRNRPSALKVQKFIAECSWRRNSPLPADIVARWTPPKKESVEKDPGILKRVTDQSWKGLLVTDSKRRGAGQGVLTTKTFAKGSIVCDYHGKVISSAAGRRTHKSVEPGQMGFVYFFHSGTEVLCVDAQSEHCDCHPELVTFGRKINHSSKVANVFPIHCVMQIRGEAQHVILFKATRDIGVNEELLYDYGVRQDSYGGEARGLVWLDE